MAKKGSLLATFIGALFVLIINSLIVQILLNMILPKLMLAMGVQKHVRPIDFTTALAIFILFQLLFPHPTILLVQKQLSG